MSLSATDLPHRTSIYRILDQSGAEFHKLADAAIALHYGDVGQESKQARQLGMADLSPLPRSGYKGRATPDWLRTHRFSLPDAPNKTRRQDNGTLIAALSRDEYLLLADPVSDDNPWTALDADWSLETAPGCYQLPRQHSHCWFAVTGQAVTDMLAKLCGVDLRLHKFDDGRIAQTSLARINAIVIRNDFAEIPGFYILADSASAAYLWLCFIDAMDEFGGAPIGLLALRRLISSFSMKRH